MSPSSQTQDRTYLPFRGVENDDKAFLPLNPDLGEIRCVILLPGSGDDPIQCDLVYTNIDKESDTRIPYLALSYCWGDIEDPVEILLHSPSLTGERTSAPFRVTRNLHIALQAIRDETRQYLWIDALCIDQQDPREKTHQVQLMGKIYSSAESVLVWLGPDDEDSKFFSRAWTVHIQPMVNDHHPGEMLRLWERLRDNKNQLWTYMARDEVLGQLGVNDRTGIRDNSSPDLCRKAISAGFCSLANRPWWSRIWVLQEVLLAPKQKGFGRNVEFRVGHTKLRWFDMLLPNSKKRYSLKTPSSSDDYNMITSFAWDTLLSKYGLYSYVKLEKLFWLTRNFQASDPRDKLFALLPLASDTKDCFWKEPLITPNYSKSPKAVFDDLVRWNQCMMIGSLYVKGIGMIEMNGDSNWSKRECGFCRLRSCKNCSADM